MLLLLYIAEILQKPFLLKLQKWNKNTEKYIRYLCSLLIVAYIFFVPVIRWTYYWNNCGSC